MNWTSNEKSDSHMVALATMAGFHDCTSQQARLHAMCCKVIGATNADKYKKAMCIQIACVGICMWKWPRYLIWICHEQGGGLLPPFTYPAGDRIEKKRSRDKIRKLTALKCYIASDHLTHQSHHQIMLKQEARKGF